MYLSNLTQSELQVVPLTGLVMLNMELVYNNHNGGIRMMRVLDQPFTVQVVAVVSNAKVR